jgi:hypothetical protein
MFGIAVVCATGGDLLVILGAAGAAAAAGTFALPAQSSLAPELARSDEELGRANALLSGLDSLATVVGPALAGLLLLGGRLELAFVLNGFSFGAVVLLLLTIPSRPGATASAQATATVPSTPTAVPRDERPSWQAIARLTAPSLALDAAVSFGSGALGVLPVVIAVELLGAGDAFAGALAAAGGVGGLMGAAAAARLVGSRMPGGLQAGMALTGLGLVGLALGAGPVIALAACAAATGGLVLLDTLNATRLQTVVPAGGVGRAFGLLNTLAAAWVMAGSAVPAAVAALLGSQAGVVAAAAVVLVAGGWAVWGDRRRTNGQSSRCRPAASPGGSARAA